MFVTLKNLVMDYRMGAGTVNILNIPEWSVEKGSQTAISGPSGSGKSTLLNIISGLQLPTSGSVLVSGTELTRLGEAERDRFRADSMGYIFQNFNLLQGYTAYENVLLGMTFSSKKNDKKNARNLLATVGLSHRMHHYPRELSIGEQQRVAIARVLSKQPELIVADEPTGSLDPLHSGEVISLLQKVCTDSGCTLILVSHDQEVVSAFEGRVSFLELNQAFTRTP